MSADRQITLTRLIAAPTAAVWRCWTDPAILPRWFGPDGFACRTKEIDLRQGGQWRFDMVAPDGTVYANRHRYDVMQTPARIEFRMDDDTDAEAPIQVVVTLAPEGAGCRITQVMTLPTVQRRQEALNFGADVLGQQTLGKLAVVAEGLPGAR